MTRHKAAGQTLVAGELREALRELPYMTPVEVGGEPVHLVETGETVSIGDVADEGDELELEALRLFVSDIGDGGYTEAQIVEQAKHLSDKYSLDD